ncbi:hypothetical protein FisN_6Hh101 [Fistulifera solaris]|uniref:Uncharacterized protein n=1 Tax=Fistulifera solaris TaxID=1519565 RepID=A0A1Z5KIJ3_FISSO|nr:hypothetical protein FisN_6Hh101 [Fistulifera solaris]|eukprot:GAX25861.1 hypothetical protein FisN_6Hh101 [Fistulifera solaris]
MSMPPFAPHDAAEDSPGSQARGFAEAAKGDSEPSVNNLTQPDAIMQMLASQLTNQTGYNYPGSQQSQLSLALSKRPTELQDDLVNHQKRRRVDVASSEHGNMVDIRGLLNTLSSRQHASMMPHSGIDDAIRLHAELLMQEQVARNRNLLAQLASPNLSSLLQTQQQLQSSNFATNGLLGVNQDHSRHQAAHAAVRNMQMAELEARTRSNVAAPNQGPFLSGSTNMDMMQKIEPYQSPQGLSSPSKGTEAVGSPVPKGRALYLPLCEETCSDPYFKRPMFPLGIDEDPNWLSDFHCFVRNELVEVFRASHEDVKLRNNSIAYQQVGLRCRFCAHMAPTSRAGRSSAFPSSLRQIYQSFTMMLRDHFGHCDVIPAATQERFAALKDKPAQGATDSKRYWIYSAMKAGMTDSPKGIFITERSVAAGASAPSFGLPAGQPWTDDAYRNISLILPNDRNIASEFLYFLMSQVQFIRLTEAERIGNRRSLRLGLPGFGCRYCCEHKRLGLCRLFPARRRTLPSKVNDIYDHLRRCSVCPQAVKDQLERTKHQFVNEFDADQGGQREFFDRIWMRLGHGSSES